MTSLPPTTGPEAIMHALQTLDLDSLEQEQRDVITAKKKTARPRAIRLLGIIEGLKKNEMAPGDLMIHHVPVIPPKFRPFSITGNTFLPGDANELYKDLIEYRRLYERTAKELGPENAGEVYSDMNKAAKAVYGYAESPNPKTKARAVKGFFETVVGTSPKTSYFQSKMLSKPVDSVGRGVVIPDADLGMDEVGIPEEMAWKLYGNYVQRRLVLGGMAPPSALRHVKDRTPQALKALENEMPVRPVVISRSPAWHATNVIGQTAHITKGDAIQANTFIAEGMTLDHDGDDVHNQVVVAIPHSVITNSLQHLVGRFQRMGNASDTQNKLQLPYIDPSTHEVVVVDLEDFPHSNELIGEKQGANSYIRFFKALPGTKVIAFNEDDGTLVWADVSGWSEHTAPAIEVVTLSNRRQTFTDNDPRAVYGMDPATGAMGRWNPTDAWEKKIAVPCGRNLRESLDQLETIDEIIIPNFGSVQLDYDFGWFLGALCGDGWWDKKDQDFYALRRWAGKRNIHIADLQEDNAARVMQFIKLQLDASSSLYYQRLETKKKEDDDRYGDSIKHSFNFAGSEHVAAFLQNHLGGDGDAKTAGSANKRVPGFLFRAPAEFRRGFLVGMVDTDGCISVNSDKEGGGGNIFSASSTSLRLIRELQALCMTLDVRSTVSWSKQAVRGNDFWLLGMSVWDCKRLSIFRDLATAHKRENFTKAVVKKEHTAAVFNKAVLPAKVFAAVWGDMPCPRISSEERQVASPITDWKKHQQNMSMTWSRAGTEGIVSRKAARAAINYLQEMLEHRTTAYKTAVELLENSTVIMSAENVQILRAGIYATSAPFSVDKDKGSEAFKLLSILRSKPSGGILGDLSCANLLRRLSALTVYVGALASDELINWVSCFLNQEHITWATVIDVQKTTICEPGYDLTVPGYETFMSADGVILSNTMSVHVPSSKAAVADVYDKMMASKQLWSNKDRSKVHHAPKHEQLIGLSMGYDKGGQKRRFATEDEAMKAIEDGQIDLNDDIEIDT